MTTIAVFVTFLTAAYCLPLPTSHDVLQPVKIVLIDSLNLSELIPDSTEEKAPSQRFSYYIIRHIQDTLDREFGENRKVISKDSPGFLTTTERLEIRQQMAPREDLHIVERIRAGERILYEAVPNVALQITADDVTADRGTSVAGAVKEVTGDSDALRVAVSTPEPIKVDSEDPQPNLSEKVLRSTPIPEAETVVSDTTPNLQIQVAAMNGEVTTDKRLLDLLTSGSIELSSESTTMLTPTDGVASTESSSENMSTVSTLDNTSEVSQSEGDHKHAIVQFASFSEDVTEATFDASKLPNLSDEVLRDGVVSDSSVRPETTTPNTKDEVQTEVVSYDKVSVVESEEPVKSPETSSDQTDVSMELDSAVRLVSVAKADELAENQPMRPVEAGVQPGKAVGGEAEPTSKTSGEMSTGEPPVVKQDEPAENQKLHSAPPKLNTETSSVPSAEMVTSDKPIKSQSQPSQRASNNPSTEAQVGDAKVLPPIEIIEIHKDDEDEYDEGSDEGDSEISDGDFGLKINTTVVKPVVVEDYEEVDETTPVPERFSENSESPAFYDQDLRASRTIHGGRIRVENSIPILSDSRHKFGYVVDDTGVRKYRVEEKTPEGYIVGEYGVLSHDSGDLRGVKYAAHGSAHPRLIYEALLKFLAL